MTVALPQGLPTSSGWQVAGWYDREWSTPPAAGGVATVELPQLDPDVMWLIDRLVCSSTSTTSTVLKVYDSAVSPRSFRTGSRVGNNDEADYPRGLLLQGSRWLVAQWTGASAGAIGTLHVQAQILRRT